MLDRSLSVGGIFQVLPLDVGSGTHHVFEDVVGTFQVLDFVEEEGCHHVLVQVFFQEPVFVGLVLVFV